jgi:hypothetical protein
LMARQASGMPVTPVRAAIPTQAELQEYCLQQVRAASTASELGAALDLAEAVLHTDDPATSGPAQAAPKAGGHH